MDDGVGRGFGGGDDGNFKRGAIKPAYVLVGLAMVMGAVGLGVFGSVATIPTVIFVITLILTGVLVARKVRGGLLIGLVAGTVLSVIAEAIWHLGEGFVQFHFRVPYTYRG